MELTEQAENKLAKLQQAAQIGWEASQRGEVVDGIIAIEQIRKNLKCRYPKQT
jgi:antitoxin ParD1/3/4